MARGGFAQMVEQAERRGRSATIPPYALNRERALQLAARIRREHPAKAHCYPEHIGSLKVRIEPPAVMSWSDPAKLSWNVRVTGCLSDHDFYSVEEWEMYCIGIERFAAGRNSLAWELLRAVQLELRHRCEQQPHSSYFVEPQVNFVSAAIAA